MKNKLLSMKEKGLAFLCLLYTSPEELNPAEEVATAAAAPVAQAAIPEGTVIGDGKLKINLARLDTRLLHGQVATAWTPDSKADRIIVASDNVAKRCV